MYICMCVYTCNVYIHVMHDAYMHELTDAIIKIKIKIMHDIVIEVNLRNFKRHK